MGEKIFADVNRRLDESGLMMHGGTIVNASLIAAPKSTKNQEGKRDPEMHQTRKGNEWYFGMTFKDRVSNQQTLFQSQDG